MSEELKIEVGEPIPNTFDYSLTPAELDKKLSEAMTKVRAGQAVPTNEHAMLGYALDYIDFVKNNMNIALNFGEESLADYCGTLEALQKSFAQNPPPADFFNNVLKSATGFFGIMVIKNLGGSWAQSNLGMTVIHNGTTAFVMNRVGRFLQGGEDDLKTFYDHLKNS